MKKRCPGFTLIEVLVAVALIGVVFTVGMSNYLQFNRRQKVVQAAQEVKNTLRFAQDKALAGEKDCSVCGGTDNTCGNETGEPVLDGWYVRFTDSGCEIYGSCGGALFGENGYDLPNGVSFSPIPSGEIVFKPLGKEVEGATAVTVSGNGTERSVVVESGGGIYVTEEATGPVETPTPTPAPVCARLTDPCNPPPCCGSLRCRIIGEIRICWWW